MSLEYFFFKLLGTFCNLPLRTEWEEDILTAPENPPNLMSHFVQSNYAALSCQRQRQE